MRTPLHPSAQDAIRRWRTSRAVPGPRGLPVLGSLLELRRDPLGCLLEYGRRYGGVVGLRIGLQQAFLISHPEGIKHILVDNHRNYRGHGRSYTLLRPLLGQGLLTSEGEIWHRHHRLAQPAFYRHRLSALVSTMADATAEMLARWQRLAGRGEPVDVGSEMNRLTLAIVTRALFGSDVSARAELVARSLAIAIQHAGRRLLSPINLPEWLPTPDHRRFRASLRALDEVVYGIIERRHHHPAQKVDLLEMLMQARDSGGGHGLNDQELRDEVMTIFLAGHETSANGLTWTWHLLSQHPEVEHRLRSEVDAVIGGRLPNFTDLANLPYTSMVFNEALRLYPPAWLMGRDALGDDEIGGWPIPAGSTVLLSSYVTHRLPAYWPDPEAFDPERFSAARSVGRPRYAYFPFGGGPRQCIGNNFALMEAQVVIAMTAQHYRLQPIPGQAVDGKPAVDMRPRQPMLARLISTG